MDIFAQNGVIISAERPEFTTEENARRSAKLVNTLVNTVGWDGSIVPCTGCFEGIDEQSYIVLINDDVAENPVAARKLMGLLMAIAYNFDQAAILVFSEDGARLLEMPNMETTGNLSDAEIADGILTFFSITGGDGMLSDLMYFEEVDEEAVELFDLDYTEVNGRYYSLEA